MVNLGSDGPPHSVSTQSLNFVVNFELIWHKIILWYFVYCVVALAVSLKFLSCWKVNLYTYSSIELLFNSFWLPCSTEGKHSQSMKLPPSCLTIGMMHSGWCASLVSFHTLHFVWRSKHFLMVFCEQRHLILHAWVPKMFCAHKLNSHGFLIVTHS